MSLVRFLQTHREMLTLTTRATYQIEKLAEHYKTNKLNLVPIKKKQLQSESIIPQSG